MAFDFVVGVITVNLILHLITEIQKTDSFKLRHSHEI